MRQTRALPQQAHTQLRSQEHGCRNRRPAQSCWQGRKLQHEQVMQPVRTPSSCFFCICLIECATLSPARQTHLIVAAVTCTATTIIMGATYKLNRLHPFTRQAWVALQAEVPDPDFATAGPMGAQAPHLVVVTLICAVVLIILVICVLCVGNETGRLSGSSVRGCLQQLEVCLPLVCRAEHLNCCCQVGRLQCVCGASSSSVSLPSLGLQAEGSFAALLLPQQKLAACEGATSGSTFCPPQNGRAGRCSCCCHAARWQCFEGAPAVRASSPGLLCVADAYMHLEGRQLLSAGLTPLECKVTR